MFERIATLARSMIATGAATITDLATLTVLVSIAHVDARVASVPALLCAGVVSFVANRRFAFRVRGAENVRNQALAFATVQAITIGLNAIVFELAMRALGPTPFYWVVRLAVSNVIYLAWSFPMLSRIFAASSAQANARAR